MYEVYLNQPNFDEPTLARFLERVFRFLHLGSSVTLTAALSDVTIHFYLQTSSSITLPAVLPDFPAVTLKPVSSIPASMKNTLPFHPDKTLADLFTKYPALTSVSIKAVKIAGSTFIRLASLKNLTIDFTKNTNFLYQKPTKYLKLDKSFHLFSSDKENAILKLSAYPYQNQPYYLTPSNYDYMSHSLVLGASGTGKSKFLSLLISNLSSRHHENLHFIVFDPHDSLRAEIGGLPGAKVFDFTSANSSVNLFDTSSRDIISSTDAIISLIQSQIPDTFNSKLEELARASVYLLIEHGDFNFQNLKRLLTDPLYRNQLIRNLQNYLPASIETFFGQTFTELKTTSYDEAFTPLLSFVDELELLPAFYRHTDHSLRYELATNSISVVSLNQTKLGLRATKTIAGLLLNQLFSLMQSRTFNERLILVIDEIAVLESPILVRFLSEARKFNVSLILAGQYYSQISAPLTDSISANVANLFCFRLSYDDAMLLAGKLNISLSSNLESDKYKLLSTLPARTAIARLTKNGQPTPAIIGESLDFEPHPEPATLFSASTEVIKNTTKSPSNLPTLAPTSTDLLSIMKNQSTSRKKQIP
ncbi:ATP-binding protein [Candidatus Saccharibacteria bacterium]|nr:ATP-binding protein [Candidatus Saccharibacteria bacterium]